ncbi:PepSY-associated TM helix domain-containing protein [Streptomyces sp. NPDC048639]|uniref:PepSY-associated TM helix domain-containing protein n=1 Tax=Streptomyces sp. NPDC048639 TaxID=3365581 RepID=UPI003717BAA0
MSVDDPVQGTERTVPAPADAAPDSAPEPAPAEGETRDQDAADAPAEGRPGGWSALRPLVLRLHFYAGLLIAPFLLVAAVTGLLYAASIQIEKVVYADELTVPVGESAVPLARQVEAALDAHPDGKLTAVWPSAEDGATTRVLLSAPGVEEGKSLAVFVDPYTAEVRGSLESYGSSGALPFRAWVSELHRHLHLGEPGRVYSELAASWLWAVALGGLLLWLGRRRAARGRGGARGLLLPERGATGRRRTLSWHGAVGIWAFLGLLFLSATGLTWSTYAGANIDVLRSELRGATPAIDSALDGGKAAAGHGDHAGGHGGTGDEGRDKGPDIGLDQVHEIAAGRKLTGSPVEITVPTEPGTAYVVKQTDKQWPVHLDAMAVHPGTGEVTDELRFADHPLLAQLTRYGIDAHMGLTFGLANQLVLMGISLGLILLIVWGYVMWWQRRPTKSRRRGVGRPMPRGAWRRVPLPVLLPLLAVTAVVGWFVPLLGISLVAFLAVDVVLGAVRRRGAAAA